MTDLPNKGALARSQKEAGDNAGLSQWQRETATLPVADRAAVTWAGPGQPIMLTLYGAGGEVAVPLLPKRALTLAQELLTCGVQAIKADPEAPWAPEGAPPRAPDLGAAGGV